MKNTQGPSKQNNMMQDVFQLLGIAILALDDELNITAFSPSAASLLHLTKRSIGSKISNVLKKQSFPVSSEIFTAVLMEKKEQEAEMTRGNQTFLTTIAPRFSTGKDSGGLILTFTNISYRKDAEVKTNATCNQLYDALSTTKAGWGNWNWITGKGDWSQAGKDLMDFYPEDDSSTSQGWLQRIHPDDREYIRQRIRETIARRSDFNADYRIITKKGTLRYINATGKVTYDNRGYALQSTGLIMDITERKRAENMLSFLANVSNDLIHISDMEEAMKTVAVKTGAFLQLSFCVMTKMDEKEDKAEKVYYWQSPNEKTYDVEAFIMLEYERLIRNSKQIVVNDISADNRVNKNDYRQLGISSFLTVPLLKNGQCRFFMSVCYAQVHFWKDDEVKLIEQLASHVWTMLERREAESELRASEEKFRTVFSSIDESFILCEIITDEQGKAVDSLTLDINPAFQKIAGKPRDTLVGKTALETLPGIESSWIEIFGKAALNGEHIRVQGRVAILDKWFDVYVMPLGKKGSGKFVVVAKDITEQKVAELSLQGSEERLRLAIEAGDIGTCDWNFETGYMLCNVKRFKMYGIEPQDKPVHVTEFMKHVHPDDVNDMVNTVLKKVHTEGKYDIEHRTVMPDGSVNWMADNGEVVEWKDEKPYRIVSVLIDITDRKMEEQRKDEFFGVASHELKTPVTSIKAYTEVLESIFRERDDNESADLMDRLNGQVDRLTDLIKHMLDTTRITGGQLQLTEETVDVSEIVKSCIDEMQLTTDRHKVVLRPSPLPLVTGDKERLTQVFTNILSNAIKYSSGNTDVIVKTTFQKDEIRVSVQDFGLGMSAGTLSRLFQRFFRSDNPKVHTYPGLGLGLYISKEIMKRHGGDILVRSKRGKGSEFTMVLPVSRKESE